MPQFARAMSVVLLILGVLAAPIATAHATDRQDVWPLYWQALRHQCPAKQLDWLGAGDLRAVLEDYKAGAGDALRTRLDRAEHHECSGSPGAAGCDNLADLRLLEKRGRLAAVTAAVCDHFALCRNQSVCATIAP